VETTRYLADSVMRMKCITIAAVKKAEEEKPSVEIPNWLPILAIAGALATAYYIKER